MTSDHTNLRVLFAEDDDAFLFMISRILEEQGFRMSTCSSGKEAIGLLKEKEFDVVILDHKMPELTGLNVLQWMNEQQMETPAVILTSAGDEVVAVESMKLGAYDYFRKEHVDINHLPVIINGVYERYLFKKEKEERERIEREGRATVKDFSETVNVMGGIVDNSLREITAGIEQCERELASATDAATREKLLNFIAELRQNYSVISFALSSIRGLTTGLSENFLRRRVEALKEVEEDLVSI